MKKYLMSAAAALCSTAANAQLPPLPIQPQYPTFISGQYSGPNPSGVNVPLAGSPGKQTFICGVFIDGYGTSNPSDLQVQPTVNGMAGPMASPVTMPPYIYNGEGNFAYPMFQNNQPYSVRLQYPGFPFCNFANTLGDSIVVNVPGAVGNPYTTIYVWGYVK